MSEKNTNVSDDKRTVLPLDMSEVKRFDLLRIDRKGLVGEEEGVVGFYTVHRCSRVVSKATSGDAQATKGFLECHI
jgi:hypothetical protein